MEDHRQRKSLLFELSSALGQCSDLDRILVCSLETVIDTLGLLNGAINVCADSTPTFTLRASRGLSKEQLQYIAHFRQKPGGDLCQQVVDSGKMIFVPDLAENALFQDTAWGESYVHLPLRSKHVIVGTMALVTQKGKQFSERDLELLSTAANVIGIAIDNALLVEQNQQIRYGAILDESERLARELHDTLAQSLGLVLFKVRCADESLSLDNVDTARKILHEVIEICEESYVDVRESIFKLRTSPSEEVSFFSTLREYLTEYENHYHVATELTVDIEDAVRLPPLTGIQVLRIIQEALSNSRKHAKATMTAVSFQQLGDCITIAVTDDGCGFNPQEAENKGALHMGLKIMRERAESIGGKLSVESNPGHGTCVTVQLNVTQTK